MPRVTPHDFRAFFTGAEAWGQLVQSREGEAQTNRVEVAWGRLVVRKLLVEVGTDNPARDVVVKLAGEAVAATSARDG